MLHNRHLADLSEFVRDLLEAVDDPFEVSSLHWLRFEITFSDKFVKQFEPLQVFLRNLIVFFSIVEGKVV